MTNKLIKKAEKFTLKGKYNKAIQLYNLYLNDNPNDVPILNQLATTYNLNGDYNSALIIAKKSLNIHKGNRIALDNLLYAYDKLKDVDNAFKIVSQFFNSFKNYEEMVSHLSFEPTSSGKYYKLDKAFDISNVEWNDQFFSNNFVSIGPKNFIAISISNSFQSTNVGKSKYKKDILKLILEKYPKGIDAWYNLAIIYSDEKEYDKALNALEKVLVKKEIDIDAMDVGNTLFKLEGYKKSDKIYQELGKLNKQYYDKALAICNEALENFPENENALQLKEKVRSILLN